MTETEKAVDMRSMPLALRLQALALALFDQTDVAHHLPVHARRLLQLAAAYYSAARHAAGSLTCSPCCARKVSWCWTTAS